MKYQILTYPTKSLLEKSKEVTTNDELRELSIHIVRMIHTLLNSQGIGLASPQVGKNIRVIVLSSGNEKYKDERFVSEKINAINSAENSTDLKNIIDDIDYLINPIILKKSDEKISINEGCLSVPNIVSKTIKRSNSVFVIFKNIKHETQTKTFNDVGSVCIQHEIDHLDGKLFFMELNTINRRKLMKFYKLKGGNIE